MERMPSSSLSDSPDGTDSQAGLHPTPPAQKRKMGWVRPILYLLLIGIVGFVVWRIYENKQKASAAAEKQATALLNRPVPVQAVPVEQRPMPIYQTALGTVTPYYSVTVKARVNGQLDKVNFIEGQQVRAGQTIMVIDPKPFKAALDQAKGTLAHDQALLKNAQAEANRYKALYDAGVVSKESLDSQQSTYGQYEGQIKSDEAAIETAQLSLDWCTIQSPISGKIGLRLVDPGNIITANTTNLVIVNQLQPIAVYFTLPENVLPQVLSKLRADQKLVAEAFDRGDTTRLAVGQLLTSDNQIDTTTGTAKQFVNIHLVLEQRPKALSVQSAAIQTGSQGTFVWQVQPDDTVKMVPVKVALAEGQYTILDSGPAAGANVVVDGADRLHDNAKVIVSAARKKTSASESSDAATQPVAPPDGGKVPGAPAPMTAGQLENEHPAKRRQSSDTATPHTRQHPSGNQP
jgi:multidrug efflux system membrane fusion protein